jgi:hypothetical protein
VDGGVEVRELFGGEEVVAIEAVREVVVGQVGTARVSISWSAVQRSIVPRQHDLVVKAI